MGYDVLLFGCETRHLGDMYVFYEVDWVPVELEPEDMACRKPVCRYAEDSSIEAQNKSHV
jgi:hypothetical protein